MSAVSLASVAQLVRQGALSASPKSSVLTNQCVNSVTHKVINCPPAKTNNFLIPNGTFFFEWIIFILVLIFLAKKVIPRITTMIDTRQATIRKQFEDAEALKARLEAAEKQYAEALAETRREASRLREQAQAERADIVEEARSEARSQVE